MADPGLQAGPRTSTRVRAALAAGVVFGLTAGLTVASWTDAEYATATLTASRFDVQTSLNGAAFTTANPITISATGLYPSPTLTTGRAYVSLRVQTTSVSVAGRVSLSATADPGGGLTPALRYRIVQAATCTASAFTGSPTYVVGGASSYQLVSAALPATTQLTINAASGSTVSYCLELSLLPAAAQATYAGTAGGLTLAVNGSSS